MNITTNTGLLGFLLTLSALSIPAVSSKAIASPSIEVRLHRITEAIRERESQWQEGTNLESPPLTARGFADGSRGGAWNQYARGSTATGAGGGAFANAHPAYGGAGFANGSGFRNGAYGGAGFANGNYGGAGFRNGAYGGAAFKNGAYGGAGFRNW